MKTEYNYYRVILEYVYGYSKEKLDTLTDLECDYEYDMVSNGYLK